MTESEKLITLEEHNENYKKERAKREKEEILNYPLSNIKCKSCKEGVYRYFPSNPFSYPGKMELLCADCGDRESAYFLE